MNRSCWIIAVMIVFLSAGRSPAAEPISVLLEKGIYTEETAGDLDGAINIYEQIVRETASNSQYAAEAAFRMGMCQLRQGDKAKAVASLQSVVSNFASQTGIVNKAKAQLVELNWEPLKLLPAPWEDGEILHYNTRLQSGALSGVHQRMVKADKLDGKNVWRIEELQKSDLNGYRQYVRVMADHENLLPLVSHYDQALYGTFDVNYERGRIHVRGGTNEKRIDREVATECPVYDVTEVSYILRRLPLTNGYTRKFSSYYVQDDRNGWQTLEVKGIEKITAPAGTFDCYRVEYSAPAWGSGFTLWMSADDRRYMVKHSYFRSQDTYLELAKVTHEPERQFFKDGQPDYSTLGAGERASDIVSKLQLDLQASRVDMQVRKERIDQIEKMTASDLANAFPYIVNDPVLSNVRKQLAEVSVEIESALATVKDASDTQVKALEARRATLETQLQEALEGLKNGLQADYEVARKNEALLNEVQAEPKNGQNAENVTRKTDKTDYPFVDDPAVLGRWVSVDFVKEIADFNPARKSWRGGEFHLKEITFMPGGGTQTMFGPDMVTLEQGAWTKGLLLDKAGQTAPKYAIKTMGTNDYLFVEWKSGDYKFRGMKPWYYVLARSP